jgi:predicted enzyme related to lactoylglutathione lyase
MATLPAPQSYPAQPGAPAYVEIGAPSGSGVRAFFSELLGWTFHDMGGDNFWVRTPTLTLGLHSGDEDRNMVVYFAVADIDAAAARVRTLGGQAPDPSSEQPGFGRFVECRDPQGIRFGLHQRPSAG